jgi:hypothetical protein
MEALADGLSWNARLLQLELPAQLELPESLTVRISGYIQANQLLKTLLSNDRTRPDTECCSYIYVRLSAHPAALHELLRETLPNSEQEELMCGRVGMSSTARRLH